MILAALVLMAQTVPDPPPGFVLDPPACPQGQTECKPWERQWKNPNVKPMLGPGPHTLVIIGGQEPVRMDFKSGRACQNARDAFLNQYHDQHPNLVASGVTAACIPR